jgi:hypothetical protein
MPISRPVPFIYPFHKTHPWVRLQRGEPHCSLLLQPEMYDIPDSELEGEKSDSNLLSVIWQDITNSSQQNLPWYCRLQGPVTLWCSKPILSLSPRNQFELLMDLHSFSTNKQTGRFKMTHGYGLPYFKFPKVQLVCAMIQNEYGYLRALSTNYY